MSLEPGQVLKRRERPTLRPPPLQTAPPPPQSHPPTPPQRRTEDPTPSAQPHLPPKRREQGAGQTPMRAPGCTREGTGTTHETKRQRSAREREGTGAVLEGLCTGGGARTHLCDTHERIEPCSATHMRDCNARESAVAQRHMAAREHRTTATQGAIAAGSVSN